MTAIAADKKDVLEARLQTYSFASALFSAPSSEKFKLLTDKEFQKSALTSCTLLQSSGDLSSLAGRILTLVSEGKPAGEDHTKVFGHTLSKDVSPYELEHLKNKDVFAQTQSLADIQGFYKAFGLEVNGLERADYFSMESEFLAFLILKELKALSDGQEDNAEICRLAQRDFFADHFSWWIADFTEKLCSEPSPPFYQLAAEFLRLFVECEQRAF